MIRRINPAHTQWPEQCILAQYIKQNPHLVFVPKSDNSNKPYSILTDHGHKKEFYLEKSILRRERKSGKHAGEYRYEIVGDEILGKGSTGIIYPSLVTLVLGERYLRPTNKPKNRLIKIQSEVEEQGESELVSQRVRHLAGKVRTLHKGQAYMVMKRMPGKDLQDILDKKKLTTEEKLQFLLALFKTWKRQVADNGLVHRDIKPENIMVNFIPGNSIPRINIIDYGFAKKREEDDSGECLGTLIYMAPELPEGRGTSLASDIYSLGKIFRKLFSENYSFVDENEKDYLEYLKDELAKEDSKLLESEILWLDSLGTNNPYLFKEDPDLSIWHQRRLENLMQKMSCFDSSQRIPIELAIKKLHAICQATLPFKLDSLKQQCPVYKILSSYPQLFGINKTTMESDEKKIIRYRNALLVGKANHNAIESEVNQITKAWHTIKKSNESPAFNAIFTILTHSLEAHEDKSTQNEFEVKMKRKIVTYIKTHMSDLITNQDVYAVKRLKAISNFLDDLEKNPTLGKDPQATLEKNLSIILTRQFNTSALHLCKNNVGKQRYIPTGFFAKPCVSRVKAPKQYDSGRNGLERYDSGIESNISSCSLNHLLNA